MRTWNSNDDEIIEKVASESSVDADALSAYVSNLYHTTDGVDDWDNVISDFYDSFVGFYDGHDDFGWEIMEDSMVGAFPSWIVSHIDWDSVWECELRHDFFEQDGYYFRNI